MITLAEYDEAWVERFNGHRRRISGALGAAALSIEHVGSTAVPGLLAKPIVDVLVTVADPDDEDSYLPALIAAGYELRVREAGHRMVRPASHDANVHVWASDSEEVERYIAFRERLRSSPSDRAWYAAVKRELAARRWPSVDHYAEAKTAVVDRILANARRR